MLEQLIHRQLVLTQLEALGLGAGGTEIDQAIDNLRTSLEAQNRALETLLGSGSDSAEALRAPGGLGAGLEEVFGKPISPMRCSRHSSTRTGVISMGLRFA